MDECCDGLVNGVVEFAKKIKAQALAEERERIAKILSATTHPPETSKCYDCEVDSLCGTVECWLKLLKP